MEQNTTCDLLSGILDDTLCGELEELKSKNLYRALKSFEPIDAVHARCEGKKITLFSTNDYLGLSRDPRIIEAFTKEARRSGTGASASRLISGTFDAHTRLEEKLAAFKKKEAAIVFATGYTTNVGTISSLCSKEDLIIIDKLNHASIIDGCRLSGATLRVYPHKSIGKLESLLSHSGNFRRTLIITDSVFSMDGDLALLREIVTLKEKYGAFLMVDEAHATGVFGEGGRGLAEREGVEDKVDITMGTFSKACGLLGGFIAGSSVLINYLKNKARSFIYSTALPSPIMSAVAKSFEIIETDKALQEKLWRNIEHTRNGLTDLGLNIGKTASPIVPVFVGDEKQTIRFSSLLFEQGIFVPGIRPPTVPKGTSRLRVSISAAHTKDDVEKLIFSFRSIRREQACPFPTIKNIGKL